LFGLEVVREPGKYKYLRIKAEIVGVECWPREAGAKAHPWEMKGFSAGLKSSSPCWSRGLPPHSTWRILVRFPPRL